MWTRRKHHTMIIASNIIACRVEKMCLAYDCIHGGQSSDAATAYLQAWLYLFNWRIVWPWINKKLICGVSWMVKCLWVKEYHKCEWDESIIDNSFDYYILWNRIDVPRSWLHAWRSKLRCCYLQAWIYLFNWRIVWPLSTCGTKKGYDKAHGVVWLAVFFFEENNGGGGTISPHLIGSIE